MSSKDAYRQMQRSYYDEHAVTADQARHLVHPDFALAARQASATQAHVLLDYLQRTYVRSGQTVRDTVRDATTLPEQLRALDFGCGVGRLMAPLVEAGVHVDGVDISERMLQFARDDQRLSGCRFFHARGNDLGEAPEASYDIVYSSLVFQHICSRSIRRELLAAFARALRPGGVAVVQMHFYPDIDAPAVPPPHYSWDADGYEATSTNSNADVWMTGDALPLVHADFAEHLSDVRLQFVDFPRDVSLFTAPYQRWFSHVIVSGSRGPLLASRLYASSGAR